MVKHIEKMIVVPIDGSKNALKSVLRGIYAVGPKKTKRRMQSSSLHAGEAAWRLFLPAKLQIRCWNM